MPSTYAHYRMGQEVRTLVPQQIKDIIKKYPDLYNIGLHGPDILFYYKPLQINPINRIGYQMHSQAGKEFFQSAAVTIRKMQQDDAYLSYLYGFICHFALDVSCHGYIDEKIAASGVSHTEIEVEFDRKLMICDGFYPITHKLTDHIIPSKENAMIIKDFYKNVSVEQMQKAIKSMISYNDLLIAPSKMKRQLVYSLLRVSGNYKEMHGLLVNYQENPMCQDSNKKLGQLYQNAKCLAVSLIQDYQGFLDGTMSLNQIYNLTFGGQLPESEELAG